MFCSCGKYNNYYKYIFLSVLFCIISTILFGYGYCNDSNFINIAQIFLDETKAKLFSYHIIIHNIYRHFMILIISIILYYYEKYISKSQKEETLKNNGIELIYENLEKNLEKKSIIYIIITIIIFAIQEILTFFYFTFDLRLMNLWILELPLFSYFNYKILNIKIYSHHKLAMYSSVIVSLTIKIIYFFVCRFSDDFKDRIYNKYKFLYFIGIFSYLIIITLRAYCVTKIKEFMDIKYISPIKLLIIVGFIGILINTIIMLIFSYNKCTTINDIDIHLCNITEIYSNRNETYLENYFIYYKLFNNNNEIIVEVFTCFIGSISHFFYLYFYFLIIKYLSVFHIIFQAIIYSFIIRITYIIILIIKNEYFGGKAFNVTIFISTGISDIVAGLGILIYCEIIELNFYGLNYNLRRNIIQRSEQDLQINNCNLFSNENGDESEDDVSNV